MIGNLTLGLGVQIAGIVQSIDQFTEARLRDAGGERASAQAQEDVYRRLESIIDPLNAVSSLTTLTTNFFNAIHDITLNPDKSNVAIRDLAIKSGELLARSINSLERRVNVEFQDLDKRITQVADEINSLAEEVRQLNLRIVTVEGGGASGSEAGGLRSQRGIALKKLAELVDVNITETLTGTTNVTLNGENLVFEATRRQVTAVLDASSGRNTTTIEFADSGGDLVVGGGELQGLYQARDSFLGGFLSGLDEFAQALTFEFNKVYSQGQGLDGFDALTVSDPEAALNAAGLAFTPVNGKFDLILRNKTTDTPETHTITVDLNGTDSETTLTSLAAAIDAISGVSAVVSIDNQLVITSDSSDTDFGFQEDTSGVLAALGLNTFFTGTSATSLGVNQVLVTGKDPGSLFAASLNGHGPDRGTDSGNALKLIALQDQGLEDLDGNSILGVYNRLVNEVAQGATIAASVTDGLRAFEGTLEARAQATSGVNLDEEAIDMIQLQRAYQASARYIQALSELLDILVNL